MVRIVKPITWFKNDIDKQYVCVEFSHFIRPYGFWKILKYGDGKYGVGFDDKFYGNKFKTIEGAKKFVNELMIINLNDYFEKQTRRVK